MILPVKHVVFHHFFNHLKTIKKVMDDGILNPGTNHRDDLYIWQTAQYVRDLGYHHTQ